MQPLPVTAKTLGRRHAGLVAAAAAFGIVAKPNLALAADEKLLQGPLGLQYFDIGTGGGDPVKQGDIVKANYLVKLASNGKVLLDKEDFLFCTGRQKQIPGWEMGVIGAGQMPPMKEGG